MNIDNILNCVDDNKGAFSIAYAVLVVVMIGVFSYSLGVETQAEVSATSSLSAPPQMERSVLGDRVAPYYVNPFDEVDVKSVNFPIDHLRGCRNWEECRILCSKPANFQACVAWEKTQE